MTILCYLPPQKLHRPTSLAASSACCRERLIAESEHDAYIDGRKLRCTKCQGSVFRDGLSAISWLAKPCREERPALVRPILKNNRTITLNGRESHTTHDRRLYRGFVYYHKCGYTAKGKLVGLARSCIPPTIYGQRVLHHIKDDKLPSHLSSWPDEEVSS